MNNCIIFLNHQYLKIVSLFMVVLLVSAGSVFSQDNFVSLDDNGTDISPVELLIFSVVKSGNNHIVQWSTSSEYNSNFFIIEKSCDGIYFETLGVKEGIGFSMKKSNYILTDDAVNSSVNYYRIKYVNNEGVEKIMDELVYDYNFFQVKKEIVKRTDVYGNEINELYRGTIVVTYSDGSSFEMIQ